MLQVLLVSMQSPILQCSAKCIKDEPFKFSMKNQRWLMFAKNNCCRYCHDFQFQLQFLTKKIARYIISICIFLFRWTPAQASICQQFCPPLTLNPNSFYSSKSCRSGIAKIGDVCTIECDRGFYLTGNYRIICMLNGLWSGDLPSCLKTYVKSISMKIMLHFSACIISSCFCVLNLKNLPIKNY